jgi:tetratricopeptide (TPR) repeat protein
VEDARGNVTEARQLYLQAIEAHERLGNRRHLAQVLGALGALDTELGDFERARASFEAALAIRRQVPNRRTEGIVLMLYGSCHELAKEPLAAIRCYREACSIHRSIGSRRLSAAALLHIARVEAATDKVAAAKSKLEEVRRSTGDDAQLRALAELVAGHVAVAAGDVAEAERCLARTGEASLRSALLRRAATVLRTALGDGLPVDALVIGKGWFKAPRGKKVDIASRKAPSLLLSALAEARRKSPGASLTVDELFSAGWPGERALPSSAASRVYVAISTLRKLGLESILIRDDAGYRLDPAVPMTVG